MRGIGNATIGAGMRSTDLTEPLQGLVLVYITLVARVLAVTLATLAAPLEHPLAFARLAPPRLVGGRILCRCCLPFW